MSKTALLTIDTEHPLLDAILPTLLREASELGGITATVSVRDYGTREWTGTITKYEDATEHGFALEDGTDYVWIDVAQVATIRLH